LTSLRCPAIRLLMASVTLAASTRMSTFSLWQWFIAGVRRSRYRWSNRSSRNKPAGAGRGARAGPGCRPLHFQTVVATINAGDLDRAVEASRKVIEAKPLISADDTAPLAAVRGSMCRSRTPASQLLWIGAIGHGEQRK